MLANRLRVVQGDSVSFLIDLVDGHGEPVPARDLEGAIATLTIRRDPAGVDLIRFTSPDASHVEIDARTSAIAIGLTSADTAALGLGAYVYQVRIDYEGAEVDFPIEWAPLDVGLGGLANPTPPVFENTVKLDHDYPLEGDLRYVTPGGSPVGDAQIRVYRKADFDAGRLESPVGITTTDADGRWRSAIFVNPGFDFVVQFFKPNEFGPDQRAVTALA